LNGAPPTNVFATLLHPYVAGHLFLLSIELFKKFSIIKNMGMKYNKSNDEGANGFQKYIDYLDTIKNRIPIELFNFISDPNRHNDSNESLHDSVLGSIQSLVDFEVRCQNMIITLLGEMREFKIHFTNVCKYKIEQNCGINYLKTFEVGMEECKYDPDSDDGEIYLVFRAEFCDGEVEIFCKEIKIEEN